MNEESKTERKKLIRNIVAVILVTILILVVVFVSNQFFHRLESPRFTIVSHNDDYDFSYDKNFNVIVEMTVYVKLRNVGADGSKMVYCEITRYDLTTYTKSQNVFIRAGEEKTLQFFFSNQELKQEVPHSYKVWVD